VQLESSNLGSSNPLHEPAVLSAQTISQAEQVHRTAMNHAF
jgi:hypothetical protein